ncbi:MAG TPA: hypothetical protein VF444_02990 [Pseudonocardiaceae bacterium]
MVALRFRYSDGFALPTILIASVVMLMVLTTAVLATSSTITSLNAQYYNQLAREAAESGVNMAEACLRLSNYRPTWSSTQPLSPKTDCSGNILSGHDWLVNNGNVQSTFSVPVPRVSSDGSIQLVATGSVNLVRTSNGAVWRMYTQTMSELSRYNDTPQLAGGAGWKDNGHNGYMLSNDGTLYGWGDNSSQQLGPSSLGTTITTPIIIQLPDGVTRVKRVFNSGQGASILCIIATTQGSGDQAYCRGSGQLMASVPAGSWQRFGLAAGLTALDMTIQGYGGDSACAIASDNQAYCAGINESGGLGNGLTNGAFVPMAAPTKFRLDLANPGPVTGSAASLTVKKVFTQDRFTCVIGSDDQAYCAGDNNVGQLGENNFATNVWIGKATPGRALLPGALPIADIRLPYHGGDEGVFFQTQSGDIYMSGHNGEGTANDGAFTGHCATGASVDCYPVPRQLTSGAFGKMISIGERGDDRHGLCVIASQSVSDSGLWCIGSNTYGQLGLSCTDRATWQTNVPVRDTSGTMQRVNDELDDEANYEMNSLVVITMAGDAYAAGDNTYGKLGTGGPLQSCNSTFQRVQLPTGVRAVAVANGDEYTTFILGDDGNVYAMGRNNNGQLGNGTTTDSSTPVVVHLPRQRIVF